MADLPLAGLKVLDFCWVAVGPMTTKYLSEYGATVLRVESSRRPETLRRAGPFAGGESGVKPFRIFRQLQRQQVRSVH